MKLLNLATVICCLAGASGCNGTGTVASAGLGQQTYDHVCAGCHDAPDLSRAPPRAALERMTADDILTALETGAMMSQGLPISREERVAVAQYLGQGKLGTVTDKDYLPATGYCPASGETGAGDTGGAAWPLWGADTSNTRFRSTQDSGLTPADLPRLKLKWSFAFPRNLMATSQPAYRDGRVFVGSMTGVVYSLDAKSGCIQWAHRTPGSVRGGIVLGAINRGGRSVQAAFYGDSNAYVTALDADSGQVLWRKRVDPHPRARVTGTPQFYQSRLYLGVSSLEEVSATNPGYECCTFRGSVVALDAASGDVAWKTYMVEQEARQTGVTRIGTRMFGPSGAPVWATPAVDTVRGRLYVGTGDNYSQPGTGTSDAIAALDMASGRILWIRQMLAGDVYNTSCDLTPDKLNCPADKGPDYDFAAPLILGTLPNGSRVLLGGQKSGVVHALDPDRDGALLWETRIGHGGVYGGIQGGMSTDENAVYAAVSDLDLAGNAEVGGGVHALDLATGKHIWTAPPVPPACKTIHGCSQAQPGAVDVTPGLVVSGSADGHLRIYSTRDGSVLWDFDTAREYQTVDGVRGYGGSVMSSGPVVADGMVFVNSGYWVGMPGNVLLAFAVQ